MKKCLEVLALGLIMVALFGCIPPDPPPALGGGTISGTVTDSVTGAPINGASVAFGSYSGITNAAGFYSIDVPTTVTAVTGTFVAYKGLEYGFRACAGIAVDPTTDPVYDFDLAPYDTSGYSEVSLSGRIFDNAATELGGSTSVGFFFTNADGGRSRASVSYDAATGYSVATKSTGRAASWVSVRITRSTRPGRTSLRTSRATT